MIQDVSQSLLSVTAEEFNQYCRDNMFKWAKRVPKTTSEWLNIICGDFIPEHLMTLGIVQCVFQFNSNNKEFISLSELPYTHFYLHDRSEVERHYDDAKHKFEFQNIEFEDDHHITLFFQAIE